MDRLMFQGFQFPKTVLIWFEAHPGSGGWMQAIVAVIAIVAVYFAATIPVRAEARSRERERSLRAQGLALLLFPEIIVLKGEIETYIESGNIYDAPVTPPAILLAKTDQLYLLDETGGRLLQAIGMVNGVAAQTRRFQSVTTTRDGVPIQTGMADGEAIWQTNIETLKLCLMNLEEAIEIIEKSEQ
jgi:hypothetical protein